MYLLTQTIIILFLILVVKTVLKKVSKPSTTPISVNYHFTRECNFKCGFCFHTAKTSYILPLEDAKRGLQLLKNSGTKKINFAGGEPFLEKEYLGELLDFSRDIGFESVSIVSNGSLITGQFLRQHAKSIDVLAVSCDSFLSDTNRHIGRLSGNPLKKMQMISKCCRENNIKFKINTVVNRYNLNEDMNHEINSLAPFRWKCFQVLMDESENSGIDGTTRDARPFMITSAEFDTFINRHRHQPSIVPEPNHLMRSSYIILDEYMRFLNKEGSYNISESILEVGVKKAMDRTIWKQDAFALRGGIYEWTKPKNLQW